ncbi:MAG: hypothetical protein ABL915_05185 [Gallionella sp.]
MLFFIDKALSPKNQAGSKKALSSIALAASSSIYPQSYPQIVWVTGKGLLGGELSEFDKQNTEKSCPT